MCPRMQARAHTSTEAVAHCSTLSGAAEVKGVTPPPSSHPPPRVNEMGHTFGSSWISPESFRGNRTGRLYWLQQEVSCKSGICLVQHSRRCDSRPRSPHSSGLALPHPTHPYTSEASAQLIFEHPPRFSVSFARLHSGLGPTGCTFLLRRQKGFYWWLESSRWKQKKSSYFVNPVYKLDYCCLWRHVHAVLPLYTDRRWPPKALPRSSGLLG